MSAAEQLQPKFRVRAMVANDRNFVIKSWMVNAGMSARGRDAGKAFDTEHRDRILEALQRCSMRVACATDDDDAILGFACVDTTLPAPVVHYVYVRNEARRNGIARAMLSDVEGAPLVEFSHKPAMAWRGPAAWKYNPYRFA